MQRALANLAEWWQLEPAEESDRHLSTLYSTHS